MPGHNKSKKDTRTHPYDPLEDILEFRGLLTQRIKDLEGELRMLQGGPNAGRRTADSGDLADELAQLYALRGKTAQDLMPFFYPKMTTTKVDANVDATVRPGSGSISETAAWIGETLGEGEDAAPEGAGEE